MRNSRGLQRFSLDCISRRNWHRLDDKNYDKTKAWRSNTVLGGNQDTSLAIRFPACRRRH
jgi:hypothetical protein